MSILYLYSYLKDNPHLCHFIKKKDMRCVIPHQSNAVNIPHQSDAELNRRGASVQSTTGSRDVRTSGSNAGYTMFRSSVKNTGYPLHSPVLPSLPLPCITMCHHISTGLHLRGELSYLAPLGSENISASYFKQCFFRGGGGGGITPPDRQTPRLPVPRQK